MYAVVTAILFVIIHERGCNCECGCVPVARRVSCDTVSSFTCQLNSPWNTYTGWGGRSDRRHLKWKFNDICRSICVYYLRRVQTLAMVVFNKINLKKKNWRRYFWIPSFSSVHYDPLHECNKTVSFSEFNETKRINIRKYNGIIDNISRGV